MARRLVPEVTCDAPGEEHDEDVQEVTVKMEGKTWKPDLCRAHREELRGLLGNRKPEHQGRSKMAPVRPEDIPRLPQ